MGAGRRIRGAIGSSRASARATGSARMARRPARRCSDPPRRWASRSFSSRPAHLPGAERSPSHDRKGAGRRRSSAAHRRSDRRREPRASSAGSVGAALTGESHGGSRPGDCPARSADADAVGEQESLQPRCRLDRQGRERERRMQHREHRDGNDTDRLRPDSQRERPLMPRSPHISRLSTPRPRRLRLRTRTRPACDVLVLVSSSCPSPTGFPRDPHAMGSQSYRRSLVSQTHGRTIPTSYPCEANT